MEQSQSLFKIWILTIDCTTVPDLNGHVNIPLLRLIIRLSDDYFLKIIAMITCILEFGGILLGLASLRIYLPPGHGEKSSCPLSQTGQIWIRKRRRVEAEAEGKAKADAKVKTKRQRPKIAPAPKKRNNSSQFPRSLLISSQTLFGPATKWEGPAHGAWCWSHWKV